MQKIQRRLKMIEKIIFKLDERELELSWDEIQKLKEDFKALDQGTVYVPYSPAPYSPSPQHPQYPHVTYLSTTVASDKLDAWLMQ